jgi:hypothetical protein
MDPIIAKLSAEPDADLRLCEIDGVAYQHDQSSLVDYDASYFNKCASYEGQAIAERINAGRIAMVDRYCKNLPVLDVGIGSGEFIKKRLLTFGVDVNPVAIRWLKENRLWADELHSFAGYTFWDVIEHVPAPKAAYFDHIRAGAYLFTSLPIFTTLRTIRESKHYRPGEHLYYWTRTGFISWMSWHGFTVLERQEFEIDAGREAIESFAFRRA